MAGIGYVDRRGSCSDSQVRIASSLIWRLA